MISIGADFLRLVHFEMQTLDIAAFNALPNCSIAAYSMRVRNQNWQNDPHCLQ